MRVIVTGGRDYADADLVNIVLDRLHHEARITWILEGGATEADRLAREWAYHHGVSVETFEADWRKHGKAAGPIRNRRMLDKGKPDMVVAFPGGRGTANMVDQAMKSGVVVEHAARDRKDAFEATKVAFNRNRLASEHRGEEP